MDNSSSLVMPIRTHVANYLGKCRNCEYWKGVDILSDDEEICEKSKTMCPLFCARLDTGAICRMDIDDYG
jgi:hypothetical protein